MNDEDFQRLPRTKPSLKYDELARIRQARENTVLSSLLLDCPSPLPKHTEKLLAHAPESFDDLRLGAIAAAAHRLIRRREFVTILSIQDELAQNPDTLELSNVTKIVSLEPSTLPPWMLEFESEELWNGYNYRRQATLFEEAAQAMLSQPDKARIISENVRRAIDDLTRNGHSLPEIVCARSLLADERPLPDLLIEGLLHKGSKLSLGGGSKTFKSWTFLSMGLSIATGTPWLDLPTTRARVLIVNFEIADLWMRHRLDSLIKATGLTPEPGYLDFWNLRGFSAPHATIIPKIIERTKNCGYGLVIIDPSYKLIGQGDENSASDVGAMMGSFEKITVETAASVGFGAHFAKGNAAAKESIDRISGSGVFARDPDTILTFTRHQQDNCFTVEATLRNLPQMDPFVVEWCFPAFQRKTDLNPQDLQKKPGRPRSTNPSALLDLLSENSLSTKEWETAAKEELGIARSSFFAIKDTLLNDGKIIQSKINRKWQKINR